MIIAVAIKQQPRITAVVIDVIMITLLLVMMIMPMMMTMIIGIPPVQGIGPG